MRASFDWDSDDVNILLSAKLAMPLMGTARIVVNSIHVKGNVRICILSCFLLFLYLVVFVIMIVCFISQINLIWVLLQYLCHVLLLISFFLKLCKCTYSEQPDEPYLPNCKDSGVGNFGHILILVA